MYGIARSIPAGAGEPEILTGDKCGSQVYPRGCGGASGSGCTTSLGVGLSPRVRGSRPGRRSEPSSRRSIPAGAGEPQAAKAVRNEATVYPRGCGGANDERATNTRPAGLSPRVRGSQLGQRNAEWEERSIPAGAGEPNDSPPQWETPRVYPRGCGGAVDESIPPAVQDGLSPRVRGSRPVVKPYSGPSRSIPAGAGEPGVCGRPGTRRWVYPRGCGGARSGGPGPQLSRGLSPRVRGSPSGVVSKRPGVGSIPAGAGEPLLPHQLPRHVQVYPRGCGGAVYACERAPFQAGLSPRVRGSRVRHTLHVGAHGSIPAGAGEPRTPPATARTGRVYPRGCGGAGMACLAAPMMRGLSPRVRGSQVVKLDGRALGRSIPAGAGEPRTHPLARRRRTVYPRGCGGAQPDSLPASSFSGLSPRVRGSRVRMLHSMVRGGSIPAGAGEPRRWRPGRSSAWVYPRGCGGASCRCFRHESASGLSPRVRGSHTVAWQPLAGDRSIPAGAGEPR